MHEKWVLMFQRFASQLVEVSREYQLDVHLIGGFIKVILYCHHQLNELLKKNYFPLKRFDQIC